jgi:hypothetical protein
MKHTNFLSSVIVFTFSFMLLAFASKPFAYTISAMDPAKGAIKAKLEQSQAVLQTKGKTSTTSSSYNISGAKSAIRLKISETVFQSLSDKTTGNMNPADYINLYKLSVGKSNRSFTINIDGSSNAMMIPVVFSSLESALLYKIAPANGLVPGEYAFIDKSTTAAEGNMIVWTFGVD